jgi:16S rRNA (cytosine967-C5)-methyltransferase
MEPTSLNAVNGQKPREIAASVLRRREHGGGYVETLLEEALAAAPLSPVDRGLCQELVYGVVRWQAALDFLIARKTDGRPQKTALQNLLRLGLYQIFWLDRIPNHAAVHETVENAKRSGFGPQSGFVNAVLRGYLREFDATKTLLADLKTSQPHIGWSHPEWLVTRWQKQWGTERAAQLLEWNNTPPKTFARINTLKFSNRRDELHESQTSANKLGTRVTLPSEESSAGKLIEQWRDENVEYDFVRRDWFDENLIFELKSHPPLTALPSFQQGLFYIQDPSTLLAVRELNPQPGEAILDLCAAPGGKTTYIAQLMQNQGKVIARDSVPERLKLIEENCTRLGVTCVETVSTSQLPTRAAHCDRILIDAPCSNTGVMRRRVDLRWRIRPEEIERLRTTQLELLRNAVAFLKPGGILVYSTCSLEPEENREVVEQFLSEQSGFKLERDRELLPFADGVDGAFVARLVKG